MVLVKMKEIAESYLGKKSQQRSRHRTRLLQRRPTLGHQGRWYHLRSQRHPYPE
jgi:hypothetical protein